MARSEIGSSAEAAADIISCAATAAVAIRDMHPLPQGILLCFAALPPPMIIMSSLRRWRRAGRRLPPAGAQSSHCHGLACRDRLAATAIDGQRRDDAEHGGEHQPETGGCLIPGMLDQPGRGKRREGAEQCGRECKGEREAGGADM